MCLSAPLLASLHHRLLHLLPHPGAGPEFWRFPRIHIGHHPRSLMSATRRCLLALVVLAPVVNRALRYAPFSWHFRRSVVAATTHGQHIPNATDVILCPRGLHRSHCYQGPVPEVFNPDRWPRDSSGREGARDTYCLATFRAGLHSGTIRKE